MGHDEKGIGKLRVDQLVIISGPANVATPTETGTIYLSGPDELWWFNGTNQVEIA